MPSIAPRILDSSGNVITASSGAHITALPVAAYTAPRSPMNVKYIVATGALSWEQVDSATSYKVYASDPASATPETLALVATVTALTYAASVLADADRRLYAVTALDEYINVESNPSAVVYGMGSERRLTEG